MDSQETQGAEVKSSRQSSVAGRRRKSQVILTCCLVLSFCCTALADDGADGRWAILVGGVSGDPDLQKLYLKEISGFRSILEDSYGYPRDHITVLFDDPSKAPDLTQNKSNSENLREACRKLSARVKKDDLVLVFIEGHGDYDGKAYRLNLVGPDPTAEELAGMFYQIQARFVIVNVTNCSGGSIAALSRKGTILITSTKSGMEKNQTHFGQYFAEAFKDNAADSDKNGRVSLLEAFLYASHRVEEYYKNEGNLQTEHPVLDDNGDAQAQSLPTAENGEGFLSRTTFLDSGILSFAREKLTPEQQKLSLEARELERQIEALKYSKGEMPQPEYEKKLEELLLKLAQINAQISR
jgi:hypothetical protein